MNISINDRSLISIEEKNKISHRGHALQLLLNKLKTMVFD